MALEIKIQNFKLGYCSSLPKFKYYGRSECPTKGPIILCCAVLRQRPDYILSSPDGAHFQHPPPSPGLSHRPIVKSQSKSCVSLHSDPGPTRPQCDAVCHCIGNKNPSAKCCYANRENSHSLSLPLSLSGFQISE